MDTFDKFANYECDGQMDIFEYQKRRAGEMTTLDTRGEAHEKVDKRKRYSQIIECLKEFKGLGLTAKECAVLMMQKGYIPTSERNFTAPRLTELCEKGIVEPIGKKTCQHTGKTVAVYALRDEQMSIFDF